MEHQTSSKPGQCTGLHSAQLDKVGALIFRCKNGLGGTASSHSTSSHARSVKILQTWIVDKLAGTTLTIDLERRDGRAIVTGVR